MYTRKAPKKQECVALYARVSSEMQVEEGISIEAQVAEMREYAAVSRMPMSGATSRRTPTSIAASWCAVPAVEKATGRTGFACEIAAASGLTYSTLKPNDCVSGLYRSVFIGQPLATHLHIDPV